MLAQEMVAMIGAVATTMGSLCGVWLHFERRLKELQKLVDSCHTQHEETKDHLLVTGLVTNVLMARMEQIAPGDPMLTVAQHKLQEMFPMESEIPVELRALLSALKKVG